MLNDDDLNRYARQVIINDFEEEGQEKLLNSKCLIVGAGGLGCPVALYASAAGFGNIEIWDDDIVELTNLNRQIAHDNNKIGLEKAYSLAEACKRLNPNISVKPKIKKLDSFSNISNFDLIFDCSDNPKTKYMLNFLSHNNQKILISGSATQMEGQLSIWKSGINKFYPCYECVFPKTSSLAPVTNCRESGIIGSITGFIGSMQVTEGIREIAFKKNSSILENSMAGYLFLYDGINQSLDKIKLTKNNECPLCK